MSKQVALIDLGSKLSVNLSKLARKLNSKQETFVFSAPAKIPNAILQEPDFYNEYYNLDRLFGILRSIDPGQQFEFVVGITHVKISEKQTIRKKERGYFSLSDGERISVVSTNKTMLRCCSPLKSQYQYLSYLIICELLLNLSDDLVFLMDGHRIVCSTIVKTALSFENVLRRAKYVSSVSQSSGNLGESTVRLLMTQSECYLGVEKTICFSKVS